MIGTHHPQIARTACYLALCTFAIYYLTLAPTIGWGDSADLALRIADWSDNYFKGTTRDYVLYRAVGILFQQVPIGDAGTRANLMTAFFGALTVGAVGFITGVTTGSRIAAVATGVSLAVSHSFWFLSVTAEVYTFNLFLVFSCFAGLTAWSKSGSPTAFLLAATFAGLALSHHATGLILFGFILVFLTQHRKRINLELGLAGFCVWIIAASLYWNRTYSALFENNLPIRYALGLGPSLNHFYEVSPLKEGGKFVAYLAYNFFGVSLALIALGVIRVIKLRQWDLLPIILWGLLFVFAGVTSSIPDKFNIYVMAYPSFAILVGVGFKHVQGMNFFNKKEFMLIGLILIFPLATYASALLISKALGIDLVGARTAPYRDNAIYFLWPPKNGDFGPRQFAEEALDSLPANAKLITDYTLWRPLRYMQDIEHYRKDVEVVYVESLLHDGVGNYMKQQPAGTEIFFATNTPRVYYQLDDVEKEFDLVRQGIVFKAYKKSADN